MSTSINTISGRHRQAFVATLLTGTFTMSISQSALSTAYPAFMRSFHLGASTVAWLTTGFMLVMSLMIPVSPWLLSNMKFKHLFQSVVAVFALGTLLCIWAPSFPLLMTGRLLEAVAVGIIFPSYQTVMLTITPQERRGAVMGVAGLVMGSALAVGPIISGVLLTWFPWRALFALFFIIAVAVFVVSFITIKDVMPLQPNQLDWLSVVLAASFPALLYVLSSATNQGMTATLGIITVLGCMGAIWFVRRQLNQERPILQLRVFATRLFTQSVLMTGISYIALIVTTIIMPLYFQNVLHVSPLVSGLSLVPAAVGLSLLNPRAGKMLDRLGPRKVALTGMTLIVIGFTLMTLLVGHLPLWLAIICAMVTEAGNAFVMMPSVTAGANALPRDLIADGTAVTTTVRQLLGSLGVAVATMILQTVQQGTGSAVSGFRATFASFALVGVVGWLLATRLPRVQERE
ncbi:MFS family major facilitator transporter, multidrug cation symporter [Lacticaseibacillus pantheris DSM 15945 = JCM 12539 = NBRC 106106]|uniref:MFS family major facilitator transporter, multidrug cation symporter n=1 Tax=Lacticaseibacillus pantheris DSM 15945 = JCM 12539 = NBRC 106106 TaxID=1423783 RepID=A0A0R1TZS9_9LACO|nr:MFS family major facilitator transporter, multidrug cation symporter [Lacticaseibacillus pantheris DSM 15945 = JCM 12539 = NBRC 106106]